MGIGHAGERVLPNRRTPTPALPVSQPPGPAQAGKPRAPTASASSIPAAATDRGTAGATDRSGGTDPHGAALSRGPPRSRC